MSIRMHSVIVTLALGLGIAGLGCQKSGSNAAMESEDDKTTYTIGYSVGKNLASLNLSPREIAHVKAGLEDAALGKASQVDLNTYAMQVQAFTQERTAAAATVEIDATREFLEQAAAEPGATRFDSGLIMTQVTEGDGPSPQKTDTVKVHYEGTFRDGTVFDSSLQRGLSVQFPLNGVIPCWQEALPKMKVGGKAKVVCPPQIAYGTTGAPPLIPPGATLIFDIRLLEIVK